GLLGRGGAGGILHAGGHGQRGRLRQRQQAHADGGRRQDGASVGFVSGLACVARGRQASDGQPPGRQGRGGRRRRRGARLGDRGRQGGAVVPRSRRRGDGAGRVGGRDPHRHGGRGQDGPRLGLGEDGAEQRRGEGRREERAGDEVARGGRV